MTIRSLKVQIPVLDCLEVFCSSEVGFAVWGALEWRREAVFDLIALLKTPFRLSFRGEVDSLLISTARCVLSDLEHTDDDVSRLVVSSRVLRSQGYLGGVCHGRTHAADEGTHPPCAPGKIPEEFCARNLCLTLV